MFALGAGALAVFGGQKAFMEGLPGWRPVGGSASLTVSQQVERVSIALARRTVFRADLARDAADGIPDAALFAALEGRDVLLIFVESYGVTAARRSRATRR